MKIERAISEVLFNDIAPQHIINHLSQGNKIQNHDLIDFNTFYRSSIEKFKKHSMDEIEKVYYGLGNKIDYNNPKTFFEYLGSFMSTILIYNEYEPKIQYNMLMRWNKISHILGQDLLTMSYLAYHDYKYHDYTDFFAYKSVINTNNRQLHNILLEGMAENHFHLKGSTQVFCLNWLSLMNYPKNRYKEFEKFSIKLNPYYNYKKTKDYSLYDMIKIAAILRTYFFIKVDNYSLNKNELTNSYIDTKKIKKLIEEIFMAKNDFIRIKKIDDGLKKIDIIKQYLSFQSNKDLDYALLGNISLINKTQNYNLVGERRIIYLFIRMMLEKETTLFENQCFYLYICIKNMFRRELIQVNDLYGFSNFSDYEGRKEIFIDKFLKYKDELIKMAIDDTFDNQNIISLEARITPKNSAIDNIEYIKKINTICKQRKDKLFYVFHFIKKKEKIKSYPYFLHCRNYLVRKEVEHQAKCLAKALEVNVCFREFVRGIDACNNEYFCRPEVFGQAFRFLSKFHVRDSAFLKQVPIEINKTYHCGEDFLDIVDGLRAIDETILFCNMENGSRLGHATVLGLDVEKYYSNKDRILMTKLDFIDNVTWLLNKANDLNINLSKYPCCHVLEEKCYLVLDEVYKDNSMGCTLSEYYYSWKLRGDNPYRYNRNGCDKNIINYKKYDFFDLNTWIDDGYRDGIAANLYYAYHFDLDVRKKGQEIYDFKIVNDYIKLVQEVQKKMQFEIAHKGIFIECNPTSNYLIAKLRRYEEHPIVSFYNDDLYHGRDRECAQINVSINTDDQGVFDTSLENEYALMTFALENCRDENGFKFTPNEVYKWIDSIRKMGIQQKFK